MVRFTWIVLPNWVEDSLLLIVDAVAPWDSVSSRLVVSNDIARTTVVKQLRVASVFCPKILAGTHEWLNGDVFVELPAWPFCFLWS